MGKEQGYSSRGRSPGRAGSDSGDQRRRRVLSRCRRAAIDPGCVKTQNQPKIEGALPLPNITIVALRASGGVGFL